MKNIKTIKEFKEPKLEIIYIVNDEIIATSGPRDDEGELINPTGGLSLPFIPL